MGGLSDIELAILVKVRDQASKAADRIGGKFRGMGKMLAVGAAAGAVALAGLTAAAINLGSQFDDARNTIEAGTGASGEALDALYDTFKDTLGQVPDDMADVSTAIADANTQLGLTEKALGSAAKAALTAGRVFNDNYATIIENGADALEVFNRDAEEFEAILDRTAVVSQATGVPISNLLGKVEEFGPVLANAGFELEDTIALFGSLEAGGIAISRVMPGLNGFFRRLAEEGVTDLKGALFEQVEAIKSATTSSEALNIAAQAFGAEGAQRMSAAIRNGVLDLGSLMAAMEGAEGTVESLGESQLTLGERFDIIKNKILVEMEPALTRLFEATEDVLDFIIEHAPEAEEKIRKFVTDAEPFLEIMRAGLETILDAAMAFWGFLQDNEVAMIATIAAVGVAIAVALGPGTLAVGAILGMIALIGLFRTKWREMGNGVIGIVEGMVNAIIQGFAFAADKIGDFIEGHINPFLRVASSLGGFVGLDLPSSIQLGDFGLGNVRVNLGRIATTGRTVMPGDFAGGFDEEMGAPGGDLTMIVEGTVVSESQLMELVTEWMEEQRAAGQIPNEA